MFLYGSWLASEELLVSREEIERFDIVGPSGRRVTLIEYQNYRSHRSSTRVVQRLRTTTELCTADGGAVQENGDGTFELFDSDEIFTRE